MRVHLIKDGKVVNTVEISDLDHAQALFQDATCVDASTGGNIGDSYADGIFTPPPAIPVVPEVVSRRQGLQAIFLKYGHTEEFLQDYIEQNMVDPARTLALIELKTSQTFERHRPFVLQVGGALSYDLDALFILAGSLK